MHSVCYIRCAMHSARQPPASRAQEGISQVATEKDRGPREPAEKAEHLQHQRARPWTTTAAQTTLKSIPPRPKQQISCSGRQHR